MNRPKIWIPELRREVEYRYIVWTQQLRGPYGRLYTVYPGLFYYSAWGYGEYYSSDGRYYWTTTSEGHELARRDGLKMTIVDALAGYNGTYLGD